MKKINLFMIAFLSNIFEMIIHKFGIIGFEEPPTDNIELVLNDNTKFTISKADILKAVDSKTFAIKDDNIMIFTKPDFETRTKNIELEHTGLGKKAGREVLAKEIRDYAKEKYGLSVDAHEDKDYKSLLEKLTAKTIKDANLPIDKKVQEHEKTIGELRGNLTQLQADNEQLKSEKEQIANDFKQKEYQLEINNTLNLLVPEKAITDTMTRKDVIALFRANGYDAKMIDGKICAIDYNKNPEGEVVKHPVTLEPEPLGKILNAFVDAKKLIPMGAGRGAGDDIGSETAGTYEAFEKLMATKNIFPGSEKFNTEMKAHIKKNGAFAK